MYLNESLSMGRVSLDASSTRQRWDPEPVFFVLWKWVGMSTLRAATIRLARDNATLRPHLLRVLARAVPPGVYDVRPDSKDHMRIRDMATKAKDRAHMLRLAMQMAKSIKDAGKAYRRGAAAADAGYPDVARVFYDRCDELAGFTQDDAAAKAERERQEQRARAERERARQKADRKSVV